MSTTMPSFDDVNLILRLYEMRREDKMRTARDWFSANCKASTADELFKIAPPGSSMNAYFRQVTSYWEMVASFLTAGVLNEELFYQSGRELLFVYARIAPYLGELRVRFEDPSAMINLETVAKRYIEWWSAKSPDAYASFKKRIGAQ